MNVDYEKLAASIGSEWVDLQAETERLRAIVEKLPTTADGVPVVPGLRVHSPYDSGRTVTGFDTRRGELRCLYFDDGFDMCVWCKYSTREAAEKAREQ